MKGKPSSPAVVEAVRQSLAQTGSPSRTAEQLGLPRTTVLAIRDRMPADSFDDLRRAAMAEVIYRTHKAQLAILDRLIALAPDASFAELLASFRDLTDRRVNMEGAFPVAPPTNQPASDRASRRVTEPVTEEDLERFVGGRRTVLPTTPQPPRLGSRGNGQA